MMLSKATAGENCLIGLKAALTTALRWYSKDLAWPIHGFPFWYQLRQGWSGEALL